MNNDIKSTVEQHPKLSLKVNQDEIHRIMRDGVESGSLWITPRSEYYRVCPTGEVESLLYNFLLVNFGTETWVNQSKKNWKIKNYGDVAKVIRHFGEL